MLFNNIFFCLVALLFGCGRKDSLIQKVEPNYESTIKDTEDTCKKIQISERDTDQSDFGPIFKSKSATEKYLNLAQQSSSDIASRIDTHGNIFSNLHDTEKANLSLKDISEMGSNLLCIAFYSKLVKNLVASSALYQDSVLSDKTRELVKTHIMSFASTDISLINLLTLIQMTVSFSKVTGIGETVVTEVQSYMSKANKLSVEVKTYANQFNDNPDDSFKGFKKEIQETRKLKSEFFKFLESNRFIN